MGKEVGRFGIEDDGGERRGRFGFGYIIIILAFSAAIIILLFDSDCSLCPILEKGSMPSMPPGRCDMLGMPGMP